MVTELKDRSFSSSDVDHAADAAFQAGALSLLFVAGRQSSFAAQASANFVETREKYARKGLCVGITSVDSLMDLAFAAHMPINASRLLNAIREATESIGALEAQNWIYERLGEE